MKINKYNALRFWEECYGSKQYAEDFHGNLMCKDGYGNNIELILRHAALLHQLDQMPADGFIQLQVPHLPSL